MTGNHDDSSSDWRTRFAQLDGLPAESSSRERQHRGTQFEWVLHAMFDAASMHPRSRFRPVGEEIDGSFLYRGRPMLFEAKWTADPIPASALYQFRGKLDGKLAGTLGLFISMSGYSADAVDALIAGKSLNLILFDGHDMRRLASPSGIDIQAAIDLKLRAAAEDGTPFIPLPDPAALGLLIPQAVAVIVEGNYDAQIIHTLTQTHGARSSLTITPAGGRLNLPLVALAQLSLMPTARNVVIVADGEGTATEVRQHIEQTLSTAATQPDVNFVVVIVDPDLETALGIASATPKRRPRPNELRQMLEDRDLRKLASANSDLAQLFHSLGLLDDDDR